LRRSVTSRSVGSFSSDYAGNLVLNLSDHVEILARFTPDNRDLAVEHVTLPAFRALGLPFSQAVRAGDFLFLSGAIGDRPGTLTPIEGGLAGRVRQTMQNVGAVLRACGLEFSHAIK
jgi:enamine deaminase RidA (YjgF/YER057c/UK114 family)